MLKPIVFSSIYTIDFFYLISIFCWYKTFCSFLLDLHQTIMNWRRCLINLSIFRQWSLVYFRRYLLSWIQWIFKTLFTYGKCCEAARLNREHCNSSSYVRHEETTQISSLKVHLVQGFCKTNYKLRLDLIQRPDPLNWDL